MNCARCGAEIAEGARFCRVCGTPVASAPAAAPIGPPPLPGPAPMPPVGATASFPSPPPLPGPTPHGAPPSPVRRTSNAAVGVIVAVGIVGLALLGGLGVGGFLMAKQMGLLGGKRGAQVTTAVPSAASSESAAETSGSASTQPAETTATPTPAAVPDVAPAGTVLNLRDKSTDAAKTALRTALLDAARSHFSTGSRFFVNQLWVDGQWAIGDIGAEKGGHRMWVVWRGTPRRVVWSGKWGVTDELVLKKYVGTLPPELLGTIDWTKPWPKAFKFVR